jgi:hypothetical protein
MAATHGRFDPAASDPKIGTARAHQLPKFAMAAATGKTG